MREIKIQYAYKNDKLYHISDPEIKTGDKCQWIDGGKAYEVYPAKGDKNTHHYRAMPGVVIDPNRAFHKDCQYYLQESKKIEFDDIVIQAHTVLLEHEAANRIKQETYNYSMIPDCLFLDENEGILCIVEVWYTHKKSIEDQEKIKKYEIPTLELKYESDYKNWTGAEWLFSPIFRRIEYAEEQIQEQRNRIEDFKRRVREEDRTKQTLLEEKSKLIYNLYESL
jgi:hypothetical protein